MEVALLNEWNHLFLSRPHVGDRASCARIEIQDLCHEGGEGAIVGRAPGAD